MSQLEILLEPTLRRIAKILPSEGKPQPLGSHLLGAPYYDPNIPLPPTRVGYAWRLMAQINFADLPNDIDPDMPTSGLLQLFFSEDSTMGMDWGHEGASGHGYLCRYIETPDLDRHAPLLAADLAGVHPDTGDYPEELFPLSEAFALRFKSSNQTALPTDDAALAFHFPQLASRIDALGAQASDDWYESEPSPFCQVGGYAYFTQSDPRDKDADWVILLQLDTSDDFDMMWGDSGVANLSIARADLNKRDFSKAYFTWDCC